MADDGADKKDGDSSDDEYRQDSEAIDPSQIIVMHDEMDQYLKGDRIDNVGRDINLGKKEQDDLHMRVDIEGEDNDNDNSDDDGANPKNFFAA